MGAREANKLAGLAAELREQVPPQFLPKGDATLRNRFAVAESPAAALDLVETPEIDTQDFSLEIEPDDEPVVNFTPEPVLAAIDEDTGHDLEPEELEPEGNVVETPGASDIHEQQKYVSAVHEEADEQISRRAFQAQDAVADGKDFESSVNGYQALGPWVNARADESAEKKRQKEDEKFTQSMLKKILEDRIKWLDEQIAFWSKERDEWREHANAFADAIERKKRGEEIVLGEDGYPLDPKLRAAVKAHEQKYGVKLNANDMQDLATGNRAASDYADYSDQQVDRYKRDRQQAQEQLREVESGGMSPEEEQQLGQQLRSLEGNFSISRGV